MMYNRRLFLQKANLAAAGIVLAPVLPFSNPTASIVTKDILLGKYTLTDTTLPFSTISTTYASVAGMYMQTEAYTSFQKMHLAAKKEGVNLKIISAVRSFYQQKTIWENKWNGNTKVGGKNLAKTCPDAATRALTILTYSSMPSTSRHHWGTDIDINSLLPSYFKTAKGKKEYEWLQKNGSMYGFCQVYNNKTLANRTGYEEEKWHWSYLPIAEKYLAAYLQTITYQDITGFLGAEVADDIQVIKLFVQGIAIH